MKYQLPELPDLEKRLEAINQSIKTNNDQSNAVLKDAPRRSVIRNEILRYNEECKITGRLMCCVPQDPYEVAENMRIKLI